MLPAVTQDFAALPVVVECFIDNIPVRAVVTPVGHQVRDVVGHDADKRSIVPGLGSEPVGQLVIPYQVVAPNVGDTCLVRSCEESITLRVTENTALRFSVHVLSEISQMHSYEGRDRLTFMTLAGVREPNSCVLLATVI